MPLFDRARARKDDPETSGEAAHRMNRSGAAARHEALILEALQVRDGQTGRELGESTGLGQVAVMRRIAGMDERGLVARLAGEKRDGQQVIRLRHA